MLRLEVASVRESTQLAQRLGDEAGSSPDAMPTFVVGMFRRLGQEHDPASAAPATRRSCSVAEGATERQPGDRRDYRVLFRPNPARPLFRRQERPSQRLAVPRARLAANSTGQTGCLQLPQACHPYTITGLRRIDGKSRFAACLEGKMNIRALPLGAFQVALFLQLSSGVQSQSIFTIGTANCSGHNGSILCLRSFSTKPDTLKSASFLTTAMRRRLGGYETSSRATPISNLKKTR